MKSVKSPLFKCRAIGLIAFSLSLAPLLVHAAGDATVPEAGPPNTQLGLAIASVPDYWGSTNNKGVLAPLARYQFDGSQKYISLMGPKLTANLLEEKEWRAGPLLKFRGKRDSDVEDDVVKQMDKVDAAAELGAFVEYHLPMSDMKQHELVFGFDVEGGKNGTEANFNVTYKHPFSKTMIGSIGFGMTYGNDKLAEKYFGVESAHDISLFPSLGGNPYQAKSGIISYNIPVTLTTKLSDEWLLIALVRVEMLQGDAKDSPVVSERGDSTQVIVGVGVSYLF